MDSELLPDAVLQLDADGVIRSANRATARILGRPPAELVGAPVTEALPLTDPQGRDWWACMNLYDGLSTRVRLPEQLVRATGPAGQPVELALTASIHRDADRRVSDVVVCLRDTRAAARQERSAAELVSVVAHELRSPLTSVKGFTATLLARWDRFTDEQRRSMLETVNADADRVTRLITELLDVARIESGRLEVRTQVVDLAEVLRRDVAGRVAAGERADRFEVVVDEALPELWGDQDKLTQVVANIVENAVRHGAGVVRAELRGTPEGVVLDVTDQGSGISVDARPLVFTKFWRGSRGGGTGLGLYVAKGIVDAHHGEITVGDGPAGGARMTVTLPLSVPDFAR